MITQNYNLNLIPNSAITLVKCSQYDVNSRTLQFNLYNGALLYSIPNGSTVTIRGTKPDKTGFEYQCEYEGSRVTVDVADQMTVLAGDILCEIRIVNGENILGSANFTIKVETAPLNEDTPISETDLPLIEEAIEAAETVVSLSETFGSPLVAQTAAEMTLTNRVYVYTGSESGYTAGNWYYYNGSAWVSGGVYQSAAVAVDSALSTTSQNPVQNKVITEEITDLKSDLSENYARLEHGNIFHDAELLYENAYASIGSNGKIVSQSSANYNAYLLPVDGESVYSFTMCRFAFLVDSDKETAIGTLKNNVTQVDSTGASYICFSVNKNTYPLDNYVVSKGTVLTTADRLPDIEPLPTLQTKIEELETLIDNKPKHATVTGNITSGGKLLLPTIRNNLRKGERIVFTGNITSFSAVRIGLTSTSAAETDGNQFNTFRIGATNISYYATSASAPVTVAHGLTITNNIQIIWEMTATASVRLTLISNGNMFEHEFTDFKRQRWSNVYVYSDGSAFTECALTWSCVDINKDIWFFGDSYLSYAQDRWTYYLHQHDYDGNCLLDGYPGETGNYGAASFNYLIQLGTPKYAVWCLGMDDGSDSESAPATAWVTARNNFLNYCSQNNVTPIFGTIPTVPSINHEQKNAWIRSSGYRYIDFAKAVGASASGVWFSGMLSNDNVHPTEAGAKALFAQALVDLPEIMLDDWR